MTNCATNAHARYEDRDLRQREIIPPEKLQQTAATVIGVGAFGRQVALQLAAMGVPRLQLIDFDHVEVVNLAAQGYLERDLNRTKVEATAELCKALNHEIDIECIDRRFGRGMSIYEYVFCCVDSIATRAFIWEAVRDRCRFFVDGRMNAEVIRILTVADPRHHDVYQQSLFRPEEAYAGSCTAQTTIYSSNIAAGLMVTQLSKRLRDIDVDPDIALNLLATELNSATLMAHME